MPDVDRYVDVFAKLDSNGKVEFSMSGEGVGGEQIIFNKDDTPGMKHDENYLVAFTLIDTTGLKLRYVKPKRESMWVKLVSSCDDDTCPEPHAELDQFKAIIRTDTVLIVKNKDENVELLKFALNFIREDGNDNKIDEYVQYDPIGDNKDGGIQKSYAGTAATVLVVILVAVAGTKILGLW